MRDPNAEVLVVVSPRATAADRQINEQLRVAKLCVQCAYGVASAVRQLQQARPAVLVLTPDAADADDNPNTLAYLRCTGFRGMLLVIGRSADPSTAVVALDRGADDYVPRSCNPTELIARVRALARRISSSTALEREIGDLVLDLRHSVLRAEGAEIALTRRETDLLEYLARNAGHPVSREELVTHIWHLDAPSGSGTNIVDVYISYLRRKLTTIGRQSLIRSVRGIGYELVDSRN